jgi:hypothetical protein
MNFLHAAFLLSIGGSVEGFRALSQTLTHYRPVGLNELRALEWHLMLHVLPIVHNGVSCV